MQTTRYAVVVETIYRNRFNPALGDWELIKDSSEVHTEFRIEGMGYGALAAMADAEAKRLNATHGCATLSYHAEPRDV